MTHPQTQPILSPTTTTPAWESPIAATGHIDETPMSHSDYDRQPLLVQALGHYVVTAGEDERFFVH